MIKFIYFRLSRKFVEMLKINRQKILGERILDDRSASNLISEAINQGVPFLISRFGTTESEFCELLHKNQFSKSELQDKRDNLWRLSGVFPPDLETTQQFYEIYVSAASNIDYCAVRSSSLEFSYWKLEDFMLSEFSSYSRRFDIGVLLPIFDSDPWTLSLENKKVLVIHPFANSFSSQLVNPDFKAAWLPKAEYVFLKAPQTLGATPDATKTSWIDELEKLKFQTNQLDFDVALIGCGAYGLPLGSFIKDSGRMAIHVGGALQLFFGVLGNRWADILGTHFTEEGRDGWKSPEPDEKPDGYRLVEGGAYWSEQD